MRKSLTSALIGATAVAVMGGAGIAVGRAAPGHQRQRAGDTEVTDLPTTNDQAQLPPSAGGGSWAAWLARS